MKTINIGPVKLCPDCNIEKPLDNFFSSKSNRNSIWYSKRCKPCHNAYCRQHRKTDGHKAVYRKWALSDRGKEVIANRMANWRKKNNEKRQAHSAVSNAIRDRRLDKKPCVICGKVGAEGHHLDYSNPLRVIWLCKKHHVEVHYLPSPQDR